MSGLLQRLFNRRNSVLTGAVATVLAAPVSFANAAGGPDYTGLTGGVDFTSTQAAVLAVAALLIGLVLAVKGAKMIIGLVRGG